MLFYLKVPSLEDDAKLTNVFLTDGGSKIILKFGEGNTEYIFDELFEYRGRVLAEVNEVYSISGAIKELVNNAVICYRSEVDEHTGYCALLWSESNELVIHSGEMEEYDKLPFFPGSEEWFEYVKLKTSGKHFNIDEKFGVENRRIIINGQECCDALFKLAEHLIKLPIRQLETGDYAIDVEPYIALSEFKYIKRNGDTYEILFPNLNEDCITNAEGINVSYKDPNSTFYDLIKSTEYSAINRKYYRGNQEIEPIKVNGKSGDEIISKAIVCYLSILNNIQSAVEEPIKNSCKLTNVLGGFYRDSFRITAGLKEPCDFVECILDIYSEGSNENALIVEPNFVIEKDYYDRYIEKLSNYSEYVSFRLNDCNIKIPLIENKPIGIEWETLSPVIKGNINDGFAIDISPAFFRPRTEHVIDGREITVFPETDRKADVEDEIFKLLTEYRIINEFQNTDFDTKCALLKKYSLQDYAFFCLVRKLYNRSICDFYQDFSHFIIAIAEDASIDYESINELVAHEAKRKSDDTLWINQKYHYSRLVYTNRTDNSISYDLWFPRLYF